MALHCYRINRKLYMAGEVVKPLKVKILLAELIRV